MNLSDSEYDEGPVTTISVVTIPATDVRIGMFIVFPDGTAAPVEDVEVSADVIRFVTEEMDYETGRTSTCQVLSEEVAEFSAKDAAKINQEIHLTAVERGWETSDLGAFKDTDTGFQVQVIPVELGAKVRVIDPETFEVWDDSIHPDSRAAFDRAQEIDVKADRPIDRLPADPEPESVLRLACAEANGWEVDEDEVAWKFSQHDARYQAILRQDGSVYMSELIYLPTMTRVELARALELDEVLTETEAALQIPHTHIDGLETAVDRLRKKLT